MPAPHLLAAILLAPRQSQRDASLVERLGDEERKQNDQFNFQSPKEEAFAAQANGSALEAPPLAQVAARGQPTRTRTPPPPLPPPPPSRATLINIPAGDEEALAERMGGAAAAAARAAAAALLSLRSQVLRLGRPARRLATLCRKEVNSNANLSARPPARNTQPQPQQPPPTPPPSLWRGARLLTSRNQPQANQRSARRGSVPFPLLSVAFRPAQAKSREIESEICFKLTRRN